MQLSVTIHSAAGFQKHTGLVDKTDIYVELQCGAQSWRTSVAKDAGSHGSFEETWTFEADPGLSEILIKACDAKHLQSDELLAQGKIHFDQRPGFFYTGEVALQDDKHGREPCIRMTIQCS
ncbi:hypothetical protein GNI_042550 [Gregarina niphandrodes]|uniref:C2 domain-containing protein n=1 Tax=Gregarina niphandrodes TaxID=110365 RepID=A0A023BA32_GRENI|nr:hypothetical protein GNI_042550 [Gregarina niphandrodes]EZG77400.1 hypothetical protein GNI_042550 [Gregarina niphandrodes]|eukprot:XP_011129513.1 hypothetical protein GNI_042550 [Gregarina niphandrodes]